MDWLEKYDEAIAKMPECGFCGAPVDVSYSTVCQHCGCANDELEPVEEEEANV